MKKICLTLVIVLSGFVSKAQFLKDKQATEQVLKGMNLLYNQEYSQAEAAFGPIKVKYSDHPVKFLLTALQIQWKNIPVEENANALNTYKAELNKCVSAALKYYEKPAFREESIFFLLASHGFLAVAEHFKGNYLDAANEARKALKYYKEGKVFKNSNPEFLFASGIYNYYRERYPDTKPIVKPVMIFFESGNMKLGLVELEKSFKTSLFSRAEAAQYLKEIYIKYETNFGKALYYSSQLNSKFPNNYIFRMGQVESLLLTKNFSEADKLNQTLKQVNNPAAQLCFYTFDGYIKEHKNADYNGATASYKNALKVKANERFTSQIVSYNYLGLARIAKVQGDNTAAKNYYKLCIKYADYAWLINTAKAELKNLP